MYWSYSVRGRFFFLSVPKISTRRNGALRSLPPPRRSSFPPVANCTYEYTRNWYSGSVRLFYQGGPNGGQHVFRAGTGDVVIHAVIYCHNLVGEGGGRAAVVIAVWFLVCLVHVINMQ